MLGPGLQPREGLRRGRLGGYLLGPQRTGPGLHVRARLAAQGCRPHVKVSGGVGDRGLEPCDLVLKRANCTV